MKRLSKRRGKPLSNSAAERFVEADGLRRLRNGETLTSILREIKASRQAFYSALERRPSLKQSYEMARARIVDTSAEIKFEQSRDRDCESLENHVRDFTIRWGKHILDEVLYRAIFQERNVA